MLERHGGEIVRVGWREWAALPGLGIPAVKTKIDTGARTSALHTFRLETFRKGGKDKVRFWVHPLQRRYDLVIACVADLLDRRTVSDSGGHRERRCVIETVLRMGESEWRIEVTLTNRDSMSFRMLLGRTALPKGYVVDANGSFALGRKLGRIYRRPPYVPESRG